MSKSTTFEKPVESQPPELVMLWDNFKIFESDAEWIIACRKCKARWALARKNSPAHTGNILALMNHAESHTAKTTHPPHPPGKPVRERGGCKVRWGTYATRVEAESAAKWARVEADRKAELGYDFGYCVPGSIDQVKDGYEVCFP